MEAPLAASPSWCQHHPWLVSEQMRLIQVVEESWLDLGCSSPVKEREEMVSWSESAGQLEAKPLQGGGQDRDL